MSQMTRRAALGAVGAFATLSTALSARSAISAPQMALPEPSTTRLKALIGQWRSINSEIERLAALFSEIEERAALPEANVINYHHVGADGERSPVYAWTEKEIHDFWGVNAAIFPQHRATAERKVRELESARAARAAAEDTSGLAKVDEAFNLACGRRDDIFQAILDTSPASADELRMKADAIHDEVLSRLSEEDADRQRSMLYALMFGAVS